MKPTKDIVCVILAGGLGKRMARAKPKVCCSVLGRPAIVRAIDTYKSAGLSRFLIVVGQKARQVLATVTDEHPEVSFAYQPKPLGTGHAAAVACEALRAQGHAGPILVVMGDKVAQPSVVTALLEQFDGTSGADLVMAVLGKQPGATGGRVVSNRAGRVLGVVELTEIAQAKKSRKPIALAGRAMTTAEIERRSPTVNASLYLFRAEPLYRAVEKLTPSKVKHELYLTDVVADLAASGRVETMLVGDPADLMAFNTQAELRKVEQALRRREPPRRVTTTRRGPVPARMLKSAGQWTELLRNSPPPLTRQFAGIYGHDEGLIAERRKTMSKLMAAFAARHGPSRKVLLCRSPGRVNLMGRHVDHRGGYVNVMAISREVLLAAAPREDDVVTLRNLDDRQFPPRQFKIGHLLEDFGFGSWGQFIDSQSVRRLLADAPGDWGHYARAALLRLQKELGRQQLGGMDCLLTGNIPIGAGLSSSSALVVAFALAAWTVNRLKSSPQDIGECIRSERFLDLLRAGDLERIGRLMQISHDGDRRFRFDEKGRRRRWLIRTDDASLERLARWCPDLAELPGRYACSTGRIDELVDIASRTEGVVGAQLAGAGLGGCAVILVKADGVAVLMQRLAKEYYARHSLPEDLHVCLPVAGASVLKV